MIIYLPFTQRDIGGTSIFARKFKQSMEEFGHKVVFKKPNKYDILFIIVDCPMHLIIEAKRKGIPIVQRLDGCYYPSIHGSLYWIKNLKAKIIHNFFANHVIYQSKYSKYSCNTFLGKAKDSFSIVYNGVDRSVFSATGSKKSLAKKNQQVIITASRFRREDQIKPILEACDILWQKRKDFKLIIIGSFTSNVGIYGSYKAPYLEFKGKVQNKDLPAYYRSSNVFIMTHLNPPCPNNILEALSCGLPICGIGDGAMPELVNNHHNGELVPTSGDAFKKMRPYDVKKIAKQLDSMLTNNADYKEKTKNFKKDFLIQTMTKKYLNIFEDLL